MRYIWWVLTRCPNGTCCSRSESHSLAQAHRQRGWGLTSQIAREYVAVWCPTMLDLRVHAPRSCHLVENGGNSVGLSPCRERQKSSSSQLWQSDAPKIVITILAVRRYCRLRLLLLFRMGFVMGKFLFRLVLERFSEWVLRILLIRRSYKDLRRFQGLKQCRSVSKDLSVYPRSPTPDRRFTVRRIGHRGFWCASAWLTGGSPQSSVGAISDGEVPAAPGVSAALLTGMLMLPCPTIRPSTSVSRSGTLQSDEPPCFIS